MREYYRFIHIFWYDDLKFSTRIVQMINDLSNGFQPEKHLFVTPYSRVYDALKEYKNVVLFKTSNPRSADIVNHFAPHADWIFINCLSVWNETLRIKWKYQPKIIWRTWGHELRFSDKDGRIISNMIKKMVRFLLRQEVRRFYAVGISNIVDQLDIKDRFGDVKTIRYPYPIREPDLMLLKERDSVKDDTEPYNVMVGHSGHVVDNHLEVLQKLEKYRKENMCIYLIFSYGNKDYMERIRQYVNEQWREKVIIVDEFLEYPDYTRLCTKMDAVILDGIQSYALGNVILFLNLRKKLYLNRKGLLHRAFEQENIPHCCTDEIGKMPYSEFTNTLYYPTDIMETSSLRSYGYKENVEQWKMILAALD